MEGADGAAGDRASGRCRSRTGNRHGSPRLRPWLSSSPCWRLCLTRSMRPLSTLPAPLRRAGPRAGGWSCTCSAIRCGCSAGWPWRQHSCSQALALHNGQLSVVQPLLATELVFMLVLRQFWIHQSIRLITWGAAALTCVGLAVFIVAVLAAGRIPPRQVSTGSRPGWPAAPALASWRSWRGGDPRACARLFMPRRPRSCGRWWRRSSRPPRTR